MKIYGVFTKIYVLRDFIEKKISKKASKGDQKFKVVTLSKECRDIISESRHRLRNVVISNQSNDIGIKCRDIG